MKFVIMLIMVAAIFLPGTVMAGQEKYIYNMEKNPMVSWSIKNNEIIVYSDKNADKIIQVIPYLREYIKNIPENQRVVAQDMNFDGYMDLRIIYSSGMVNKYYHCWLWNNEQHKFVLYDKLSEITSPVFHAENKTISSYMRVTAAENTQTTYSFKNNQLKIVDSVEQSVDRAKKEVVKKHYGFNEKGEAYLINEYREPLEKYIGGHK